MKFVKFLSAVLVLAMLAGLPCMTASAEGTVFSDVSDGVWYADTVAAVAETGIIAGYPNGTFNPNGQLTWAQTVVFATRIAQYMAGEHVFGGDDQPEDSRIWYQVYVDYALEHAFITAVPDNPSEPITRADAAVIFSNVLGNAEAVNDIPDGYFVDLPQGEIHDAVYALARAGVVNGMSNTGDHAVYGSDGNFTRAQAATLVARLAGLVAPTEIVVEPATPDFEKYNIPISMKTGQIYDFNTICYDDHSYYTVGKASISGYKITPSDEEHSAKAGYEWRIITFTVEFSDENAYNYGMMWSFDSEDYYNVARFDDTTKVVSSGENTSVRTHNVINNGVETEVTIVSETLSQEWDENDVYTLVMRYSCQVPVGYDGIVIGLHSPEIEWPDGKYIYDLFDSSRWLLFRLD